VKTGSIVLTPLREADLPRLFDWINDRHEVLFNAAYKPVLQSQHRAWFESLGERRDLVIFAIRLGSDDALVGTCQLRHLDLTHRNAELQIRLGDPGQRGHGYGTQAVRLLLDFAFRDLNLHRVYLHVFETNAAAIRAYEKAGFVREGILRQAAHIDGAYVDIAVMGKLREEHV
jgi:RimJ/RimL family protein N-acetyltransferase